MKQFKSADSHFETDFPNWIPWDQRRLDLEAQYSACAELNGNATADGEDKIKLNVGGVRVVAKRSTLTVFPHSKLAKLFSGRWDKKLQRDKKNRIFLDVDPVCFKEILDYLISCFRCPTDSPLPLPEVSDDIQDRKRLLISAHFLELPPRTSLVLKTSSAMRKVKILMLMLLSMLLSIHVKH